MEKSIYSYHQKQLQFLLRQTRVEAGLSQIDLSHKLCRPQSFISKYESGERRLDLVELKQICDAIGVALKKFIENFEALINEAR